jgi:hypothetical protein
MQFRIHVKDDRSDWWEEYDENIEEPRSWAENIIFNWNLSLRPHERKRELIEVKIVGTTDRQHQWEKRTDGMSVEFRGQSVDLMICSRCFITGKRHGLSSIVKRDSKYTAKRFEFCVGKDSSKHKDDENKTT